MDKTLVYFTDSQMDDYLADKCRKWLRKSSLGLPIVCVSQKPLTFGDVNICVGEIGYSPRTLYASLMEGLMAVETKWVQVAEHDCLYTEEHTRYIPPDDKYFYYNNNVWMMQYANPAHPEMNGMFSHRRSRRVQSQLICATDIYRESTQKLLTIHHDETWNNLYSRGRIAEPGTANEEKTLRLASRSDVVHLYYQIKEYLTNYQARDWKTVEPNIDIRHGKNFTGPRRGNYRNYSLGSWGTMEDILGAV